MFMCSTCLFKRSKWIPTILPTFQKLSLFHKFLLPRFGFGNFLEKFCFGEDHCFLLTCSLAKFFLQHPTNIYLFKVSNRNTRKRWKVSSKLIKKNSEWRHSRRSGDFIVNFEHISHLFLVYLLLILNK